MLLAGNDIDIGEGSEVMRQQDLCGSLRGGGVENGDDHLVNEGRNDEEEGTWNKKDKLREAATHEHSWCAGRWGRHYV